MTQIQHVTAKEMTRRTGVRNALGYTFPEKDLILLRKTLSGKRKRKVLDHEIEHLKKGEEGPFIDPGTAALGAAGIGAIGSALGGGSAKDALQSAIDTSYATFKPQIMFGNKQLRNLEAWLRGPQGAFAPITAEDVMASPEYQTALNTFENSAIARGGLQSGNALRGLAELAPAGIQAERQRRYQEMAQRLGLVNLATTAGGAMAGVQTSLAPSMASASAAPYNALSQFAGDVAGIYGQKAAMNDWRDFMSQYNNPGINPYASP